MRIRLAATLAAAAALLLSACSTTQPAAPVPALEGTSWTVTAIQGTATITDNPPLLDFADGQITGTSGCNRFFGPFKQDQAKLTLGPTGATMMACTDEAVTAQETTLFQAFEKVTGVQAVDAGVELTGADGKVLLALKVREPEPDKPLQGTNWILDGIIEGDAVSSVVGDDPITLTIADGKLHASACNQINGDATVDGQNLKVGPLMSTRMACPSEEETIQEGQLIAYLEAATGFEIKGSTLTITAGDNGLAFRAE